MLIVKVWCLPKMSEKDLRELHQDIVEAARGIDELEIRGERDMTVLFPPDVMTYGLGTDIVIEVTIDAEHASRNTWSQLAAELMEAVRINLEGEAFIDCIIMPIDMIGRCWTS